MSIDRHIIVGLLCYLPIFTAAQPLIQPEIISIEDGLSQGFISCIHQDNEGFIWFGTKNGLNRYDGVRFKVFTADHSNPNSISNDHVLAIHEEGDFLLLGTSNEDVSIYHKQTEQFHRIEKPVGVGENDDNWTISSMVKDRLGQFWLFDTHNEIAWIMTLPVGFWEQLPIDEAIVDQIKFQPLSQEMAENMSLSKDSMDITISGKEGSLWQLDIRSIKRNTIISNTSDLSNQYRNLAIGKDTFLQLGVKETGNFSASSEFRILAIEEDSLTWISDSRKGDISTQYHLHDKPWFALSSSDLSHTYFFEKAWVEYGQLSLDAANYRVATDGAQLISNLTDRSGNIWLGTYGLGVQKISTRRKSIKTLFVGNSIYRKPFVFADGTTIVFSPASIGTYLANEKSDVLSKIGLTAFMQSASDVMLWKGVDDAIWFYWRGIEARNTFTSKMYKIPNGKVLDANQFLEVDHEVSAFHQDARSKVICFGGISTLTFYHPTKNEIQSIELQEVNSSNEQFVYCIRTTANGHWWIGTAIGLAELIPQTNEGADSWSDFTIRWHQVDKSALQNNQTNGLLNDQVAALLTDIDDENILWIGTKGGGLHRLNTRSMEFEHLTMQDGLPNDVLYGILADDHDNLWMSSNKGIIKYHPASGRISNYTKADGLQDDEFNTWAYGKTAKGELIFGGINGLNIFDPDAFQDNPHAPQVKLTGLRVNNVPISVHDSSGILQRSITTTEELRLPFQKNSFTLEFAALEFTAPEKNRFRYYLEGSEVPWQHEGTRSDAQYLSLAPGSYTFKIKAANGDGVWSEQITSLAIHISPPWYRSTMAYVFYILLISLAIWMVSKMQRRRLQLQYEVAAEQREKEQLKELDAVKGQLYTNITHEFRTPLTVISGMADQLKGNEESKELIKRNSFQLLNLVNQMLELRKLESGTISIHPQQSDVVKFLRYLTESLKSYAFEAKGIVIHLITDLDALIMDFDSDILTRIYSNLLSNAIKFTPENGHIYVQLEEDKDESQFKLTIRDTGVGISEENLPHIFKRFYQVAGEKAQKNEGTGIGLTLVAQLVESIHGKIQVQSKLGRGTTFTIELPIRNDAELSSDSNWQPHGDASLLAASLSKTAYELPEYAAKSNKPTVLIVEDNADVIHYLISCLKAHYDIDFAMNGEEGIEKAIEDIPDLIVSDVMMPVKDGFELCQTLKSDQRSSHIPIVLLTAKVDFEARIKGLERGADVYLSKPFHQEELLLTLKNLLELRKQMQSRFMRLPDQESWLHTDEANSAEPYLQYLQVENEFLLKIRTLVEEDLSNSEIGIPQLIRRLGMSRSQIYKKVKALTGKSPTLYIRTIRLYHAHQLLKTTDLNVSEVAYEVGFTTPSYFSTAFLEEFGFSPNETRK